MRRVWVEFYGCVPRVPPWRVVGRVSWRRGKGRASCVGMVACAFDRWHGFCDCWGPPHSSFGLLDCAGLWPRPWTVHCLPVSCLFNPFSFRSKRWAVLFSPDGFLVDSPIDSSNMTPPVFFSKSPIVILSKTNAKDHCTSTYRRLVDPAGRALFEGVKQIGHRHTPRDCGQNGHEVYHGHPLHVY